MLNTSTTNSSRAIIIGLFSALFFAVTFVLNRMMSNEGGSWIWSAAFRFFFMLPFLVLLVLWFAKKHTVPASAKATHAQGLHKVFAAIKAQPVAWLLWSSIGFGVFYAPLTFAAAYAPAWLVASTWQFTIIAGLILAPFITSKVGTNKASTDKQATQGISKNAFVFSGIILAGIMLMQVSQAQAVSTKDLLYGTLPVIIAAFAYPLGNRKMMQLASVQTYQLNTFERTLGMTLASLPFWLVLSVVGMLSVAPPSSSQLWQTLVVAICSGVIATTLFFMATDMVKTDQKKLAAVEATQSAEVLFALVGEILLLGSHLPDRFAIVGMGLVIVGMVLHSTRS